MFRGARSTGAAGATGTSVWNFTGELDASRLLGVLDCGSSVSSIGANACLQNSIKPGRGIAFSDVLEDIASKRFLWGNPQTPIFKHNNYGKNSKAQNV